MIGDALEIHVLVNYFMILYKWCCELRPVFCLMSGLPIIIFRLSFLLARRGAISSLLWLRLSTWPCFKNKQAYSALFYWVQSKNDISLWLLGRLTVGVHGMFSMPHAFCIFGIEGCNNLLDEMVLLGWKQLI